MARYIGIVQGKAGEATRLGSESSGIRAQAQGWCVGVTVYGLPLGEGSDLDAFEVYATAGSGGGFSDILLGTVYRERIGSGPGSLAALPIFRPNVGAHIVRHEREERAAEAERHEAEAERMRQLGEEYGYRSAAWLLDGNSTREAAERLLVGILSGDPLVMDQLPSNPLSGEWAGSPSGAEIIAEAGLDFDGSDPDSAERESDLLDAYSDGFAEGSHDGAETLARTFLGIPEGAAAEVLTCCDCGRTFVAAAGVNYCAECEDREPAEHEGRRSR